MRDSSAQNDEIFNLLDKALCSVLQETLDVPSQHRIAKRRFFGVGLLCISLFCLGIAIITGIKHIGPDTIFWIIYSFILLMIGAWQIDKSAKDEQRAFELLNSVPQPTAKLFSPKLVK